MIQGKIKTQLTLRQLDIIPNIYRYSHRKGRNFMRITFYIIYVIGNLEYSIL